MASRRRRLINGKRRAQPYCPIPGSRFCGMTVGQVEDLPPKKRQRYTKQHNKQVIQTELDFAQYQFEQHYLQNKSDILQDFHSKMEEIEKQIANENAEEKVAINKTNKARIKQKVQIKARVTATKAKAKTKANNMKWVILILIHYQQMQIWLNWTHLC